MDTLVSPRCAPAPGSRLFLSVQNYRQLRVLENAHKLAVQVRRATNAFPRSGYAALKAQITTAAESIAFNIVEGCGARSQRDFARFLDISVKSSSELEYQLQLARDYEVLAAAEWQQLTIQTVDVRRMLCGLRAKVLASTLRPAGNSVSE